MTTTFADEPAAVIAKMTLEIASLHEATVNVSDSVSSAEGVPASFSSGVSSTSSASSTLERASSRVLPSLIAPGISATCAVTHPSPASA